MTRGTKCVARGTALMALLALLAPAGQGQSLGELSRQERARKSGKTAKEYTNDNIPAAALAGSAPAAPADGAQPGTAQAGDAAQAGAATGDAKPAEAGVAKKPEEVEKEYREKAARLKEDLAIEERRLDVLQRELNLTQQQYYSDPNVALREQYSREDINKRTAEIDAQKALVDKAKQAIADLEDELRRNRLPAGWAR